MSVIQRAIEQGKGNEVVQDKRTVKNDDNKRRVKHLKFARDLPIKCDDCKFRAKEDGGNGMCVKYEQGAMCVIRKDAVKLFEEYQTRNPDQILPLMEEEFANNYIKLKTFEALEDMHTELNPEVTRRIGVLDKLGKTINEMKSRKQTIEIQETKTLSTDKREQIAQIVRLTQEKSNETD